MPLASKRDIGSLERGRFVQTRCIIAVAAPKCRKSMAKSPKMRKIFFRNKRKKVRCQPRPLLQCSILSILCTLSCAKVTKSSCIEEPALLQSCWFWHRILSINIFDCRYEVLTFENVWIHLASLICFLRHNHVEITDGSMISKLPMDQIDKHFRLRR